MNPYNKERASVKDALSLWRKSGVFSLPKIITAYKTSYNQIFDKPLSGVYRTRTCHLLTASQTL